MIIKIMITIVTKKIATRKHDYKSIDGPALI